MPGGNSSLLSHPVSRSCRRLGELEARSGASPSAGQRNGCWRTCSYRLSPNNRGLIENAPTLARRRRRRKRGRRYIHCMKLPGGLRNQGRLPAKKHRRQPEGQRMKEGTAAGDASLAGREIGALSEKLQALIPFSRTMAAAVR